MKTIALVPVKGTASGKKRLSPGLSSCRRSLLIDLMLSDLLRAIRAVREIDDIWIISADDRLVVHCGTLVRDMGGGLNTELWRASTEASRLAGTVLILAADLPLAESADIASLAAAARSNAVVVVPDRRGNGTNALALSPPTALAPHFGPDSRRRHEEAAQRLKLACCTLELASLSQDVDVPEDIGLLIQARPERYGFLRSTSERFL